VISPIPANVFLHYVFDLWINQWRKRHCKRKCIVVRYADDFVIGFEHEARACLEALKERLRKLGLELQEIQPNFGSDQSQPSPPPTRQCWHDRSMAAASEGRTYRDPR
jgi:hypothetical protein